MLGKTLESRVAVLVAVITVGSFVSLSFFPTWAESDCPSCASFGVARPTGKNQAPPFTLRSLDGGSFTLDQFRGKPLLLFFWGTWCEACKEDIVLLEKFAQQAKERVTIVTLVIDGERDRRARQIVTKLKITLPVLLILKENVIDTYEVRAIPTAFFVDSEGFILGKIVGQRDWSGPAAWCVTKELFGLN